jgi:hypothetical protein
MTTNTHAHLSGKIINPELAQMALRAARPCGEFKVIVRLQQPGKLPRYIKAAGLHSPGHIKGRMPCEKIEAIGRDSNIVSLELREHVMQ